MRQIKLSPTSLNLFLACPRCFWLEKNRSIKRPRGIFPTLPTGMDLVIKTYFDEYRFKNELPREIKKRVVGRLLADKNILDKWRDWRKTDLYYKEKNLDASLSGALDDCLVEDNFYIPLDYKTRGSNLKEDPRKYYQIQLDCYCLILEASGYKTKGLSYLIYYWPEEVREDGFVRFCVEPIKIETDINRAKKVFEDAVTLLSLPIPKANDNCEYCNLVKNRKNEIFS